MSHQAAIDANRKAFQEAEFYDSRECMLMLSPLFAKTFLEYTPPPPAASTAPPLSATVPEYGDVHLPNSGITHEIIDRAKITQEFTGAPLKVLDFACGTGLTTRSLTPYLAAGSEVVGIDINEAFLKAFDTKQAQLAQEWPSVAISRENIDILDPSKSQFIAENYTGRFDRIVCTISYHHLHNYEEVTKKLATFLKKGTGKLFIVDFYNEDVERGTKGGSAVQHMGGLKVEALTKAFADAGLHSIDVRKIFDANMWQGVEFIENHCNEATIGKFKADELEKKTIDVNRTVYSIKMGVILAVGTA